MSNFLLIFTNFGKETFTAVWEWIKYIKQRLAAVEVEENDPLGPLPKGWDKRVDNEDREYFAHQKSKITQWEDPRTHGFEDPLPPGWHQQLIGVYPSKAYIDTNTNTFTFIDPRTEYNGEDGEEGPYKPVPYYLKLKWKIMDFHSLCECNKVPNTIRLAVSRKNIFKDSFSQIMKLQPQEMRGKFFRTFKGETYGNHDRFASEWFLLLSEVVLDPAFGLFEYADKYENSVQINPASSASSDNLLYFKFIGRIVAMAIFHEKIIHKRFTIPFYKCILGKEFLMKDIELIDTEFYNSLVWIKQNDIEECDLELYFSVNFEILGKVQSHDLLPGGSEIKVTQKNKKEFLKLMTSWRLTRGQKRQMKSFLSGFNEVFPSEWLGYFDEMELESMLCGSLVKVDLKDWREHTTYIDCSKERIEWFWEYVGDLDYEVQIRLLQFVTGIRRVPAGGFADLMGSYGPQWFCIQIVGDETGLPKSYTCFNRLEIPPYPTYYQFVTKMTLALEQTVGLPQTKQSSLP